MNRKPVYFLTVFILLSISAGLAMVFGFISPDSWEYLHLAQSLRNGKGCLNGGSYFAALPCGYPIVLALTAPSSDIASLMISSKFTNLLLLFSAFLFMANEFKNVLVPTVMIINPITMAIYQYTWSENLFLFAFCGAMYAISRIERYEINTRYVTLLTLFLVVGCASRYFFGPFAAVMFIAVWLSYGTPIARKTFPAFLIAGAFFLAYQGMNIEITGYGSGMSRVPAPESIIYLMMRFLNTFAHIAFYLVISLLILIVFSKKYSTFDSGVRALDDDARRCFFLAYTGIGFLILAFLMRASTHFDMYSTRTIGYGLVFIVAAFVGRLVRIRVGCFPVFAAICCGLFSILAGHGAYLPVQIKNVLLTGEYQMSIEALHHYHAPATEADLIVELATPAISSTIDANSSLYYKQGTRTVGVATAPFRKPETLDEFKKKIFSKKYDSCVIDFNPFRTIDDLKTYVDRNFIVDVKFDKNTSKFIFVDKSSFDPTLKNYLLGKFQPGRYVVCTDVLSS